jgi:ornithine--oxo-acid transaminase
MRTEEYVRLEESYGAKNYLPLDVVLTHGEGVWVEDVEGRRYMDFLAAYSALNHGHRHPRLVRALTDQAGRLTLTSRAFRNEHLPLLEKELCELLGYDCMLPMNTGAEAVETALKAVRKWGYEVRGVRQDCAEILACTGNFHGRTTTIVGFSSDAQYQHGFGPFAPGFKLIPFGDAEALRNAISPQTVGFLVEPVQGEAGVVVPPDGYLAACADICRKRGILLIADEIQSGLGRTGTLLASEHEGVKPDVVCLGKALGGGMYPVSAMLTSREVMNVFRPGDHGSTFGGNPLGCAVAREALRVLVEEDLCARSAELGAFLLSSMKDLRSRHIDHCRGRGLWIGVVLTHEAGGARGFCERLMDEGLLCKETHENVIRLAPPLIVTREELEWAVERLVTVLSA